MGIEAFYEVAVTLAKCVPLLLSEREPGLSLGATALAQAIFDAMFSRAEFSVCDLQRCSSTLSARKAMGSSAPIAWVENTRFDAFDDAVWGFLPCA